MVRAGWARRNASFFLGTVFLGRLMVTGRVCAAVQWVRVRAGLSKRSYEMEHQCVHARACVRVVLRVSGVACALFAAFVQ